ncbi:MAG: polysaccharide deacetylase family protein [Planctomycetota bacterium]
MSEQAFEWPDDARAAVSFSFDDARPSQLDRGVPILDAHGLSGTFYVSTDNARKRRAGWRRAAENGHEMGNHSLRHPCSGNFPFARANPLEEYCLESMEAELLAANEAVEELLGVHPQTFAYPCGQTFVGRGPNLRSYVPVVARHFVVGRRAFDEVHNHPLYCDLARATSLDLDDAPEARAMELVEAALEDGGWLIFMSHELGEGGRQVTRADVLEAVCRRVADGNNGIWADTVAAVGRYVRDGRESPD